MSVTGGGTYGVLGPVLVESQGHAVRIASPKGRVLLAALILADGAPVPADRLLDVVYDDRLPAKPLNALHQLVARLRNVLGIEGLGEHIVTSGGGYRLAVPSRETDVGRLARARRQANTAAKRGDLESEMAALEEALGLWRGEPLADVDSELLRQEHLPFLAEVQVQLGERRIGVALALHREADVIEDLVKVTGEQPLRETPWAQLMMALEAVGRRADAIDAFHRARTHLRAELGVEPGELLQRTHLRVLENERVHMLEAAPLVPRQLPAEPLGFAGRQAEITTVMAAFENASGDRPVLISFTGMAGVGKTSLAIHTARRLAPAFPDGQLWVNLRGASRANSETPQNALPSLIRALGHPGVAVPQLPDEQASLFRSMLDGRRVLIVFDDARNAEQVRPLLPATPGSAAIITSRWCLDGLLVTDGVLHVPVRPLNDSDAREMLRRRIGRARVDSESEAATRLLHRTGRLPLALAVVAARAAAQPDAPLGVVDGQLSVAGSRLDAFSGTDERSNLRVVFSWSYASVSEAASRVFRLLGLHPTPDLTWEAAISLTGHDPHQLRPLMEELQDANLLNTWATGRFVLHDLLHAFAAELAAEQLDAREQAGAVRRTLDHYSHTAHAAAELVDPLRDRAPLNPAADGVVVCKFDGEVAAMAWLARDRKALLACPEVALARGLATHAWENAWGVADLLVHSAAWDDLETLLEIVLIAAERDAADHAAARAHQLLGRAHGHLDHPHRAAEHLKKALTAGRAAGDTVVQARALAGLATLAEDRGDWPASLLHDRLALAIAQRDGHRGFEAEALNHVGWDLAQLGRHGEAVDFCGRALTIAQELGHRRVEAAALDSLGFLERRQGRHAAALKRYKDALRIRRDLDHKVGVGRTQIAIGDTLADQGSIHDAAAHWQAGIDILDRYSPVRAKIERRRLGPWFSMLDGSCAGGPPSRLHAPESSWHNAGTRTAMSGRRGAEVDSPGVA